MGPLAADPDTVGEIEDEAGVTDVQVLYDRGGVRVVVATTPEGPVVGVRSPHGHARIGPAQAALRPVRTLDELHLLASYRTELDALDIRVPAALASSDPHVLARATGAPVAIVKRWQAAAELLALADLPARDAAALALAGVDGVTDLARRSAVSLADELNRRLALDQPVRQLYDERATARWIESARAFLRDARSPTANR